MERLAPKETAQNFIPSVIFQDEDEHASIVVAARNALASPFHCWACHIPNHSPATAANPPS